MASAGLRNPPMTKEELQGSQRNADTLKAASRRIGALAASSRMRKKGSLS
jgi:hypothetical protein